MAGKSAPKIRAGVVLAAAILAGAGAVRSAPAITKASSGTVLSAGASWVGNVAPATGDVATFDGTANTTADTLGANDSWLGIQLLSGAPNVAISGANLLTLGSSGIDLSSSGKTLTLSGGSIALAAPQTWSSGTVASALLGVSSTVSLAGNLLTIAGTGNSSLSGIISGAGGIQMNGAGTLTLAAQNTYSGGTTLNSGVTIVGSASSQTTALGSGLLTLNGSAAMRLGVANLALTVNGLASTSSAAVITGFGGTNTQGTLTINNAPGFASSYGGSIGNGTGGSLTLLLTGGGTQTLYGNNTYTGSTIVRNGVLEISGGSITSSNSTATSGQTGIISVGDTAEQDAVLLIDGGVVSAAHNGPYGVGAVTIGDNNSAGAIYLNSGTLTTGTNEFWTGSTGSGYVRQTGGDIVSNGYFPIGRPANTSQQAGVGIVEISGGTLTHTNANDFEIGAYDPNKIANPAQIHGVLMVSGGFIDDTVGNFQVSNYLSGVATVWNNGIVNATALSGIDIQNHDGSDLNGTRSGTGLLGVLNLGAVNGGGFGTVGGGTIITSMVQHSGLNTGIFNFHGGTLVASNIGTSSFMAGLTHAYVYAEGGTIDANGLAITIDQPLEGPSGYGLISLPLANSGSGYIAPPVVTILGGTGATLQGTSVGITASAIFDLTTGSISGIAITNPGSGLQLGDALTITLTGGGASVPATLAAGSITILSAANTAPNASGNLTFNGGGTVSLTATNTFQGTLTVAPATTVQFGSTLAGGATSGTFTGNQIVDNGALVINRSNGVTLSALLTGSGTLTQNGNGVTTITHANFSGTTVAHAGTLTFGGGTTQTIGPITENAPATVTVATSTTLTAGPITVSHLEVDGTLLLSYAPVQASRIAQTLAFGGSGRIDLGAATLVVQAAPEGATAKSSLLAALAGEIITGQAGGLWNGPGLGSSFVAANPAYTLALIDNAQGIWPTGGINQSVDANSVFVTPALLGDFNGDGVVNAADFALWASHAYTADYSYADGDATGDGMVDNASFALWYAHDPNANADMAANGWALENGVPVQVPEPATLALWCAGGLLMGRRRPSRRRL